MLDSHVYKSQWREPHLCREYYFLATENSGYFELSSKTKDQTKKEAMHTFISFKEKRIRDPPLVIGRSPLVAPVIGG